METLLQGRSKIFLRDFFERFDLRGNTTYCPREANLNIQDKVDNLKVDIAEYVKSEFEHRKGGTEPFFVTDKDGTFQPVPVLLKENGEVEFCCDDINFWLMVVTYEIGLLNSKSDQ